MEQTGAQQYSPQGADWYQAYAQSQQQAQPFAQPFPQAQAQPYALPQAQPYAQPQAQAYAPPQAQQLYAQPQAQPYAQPQTQAAPVPPVAAPQYVSPTGGAAAQASPQQQLARHLMGVARTLEQAIPGYQILISIVLDLNASPKGESISGLSDLLEQLEQAAFIHYATLGSIRRFLVGEATPDVLASLAIGVNRLIQIHTQARPLWDRALMSAGPDVRQALSNLNQVVSGASTMLSQAAQAVQAAVGPQVWAAAQARVQTAPAPAADAVPAQ